MALDDPIVCVKDTIIYLPPLYDPGPPAGSPFSNFSDNVGNDLINEQTFGARRGDERNAYFGESSFAHQQLLMLDSLEAEIMKDIMQELDERRKKESTIQSARDMQTMSTTATPAPQRDALIAIYNATGGNSWLNNDNWLTTNLVSTWDGVTTDVNGNVIRLNLESNNLSGSLPAELGDLIYLRDLNLSINQITGLIPNEIGSLSNLRDLFLDNNSLSGPIPNTIGNLSNLRYLLLSNNSLSGPIPKYH